MGELPFGRALGIGWDTLSNTLGFTLAHLDRPPAAATKQGILCRLAGLYEPLGRASPFIVCAKVMLQRTWVQGLDWDALLPSDMAAEYAQWQDETAA